MSYIVVLHSDAPPPFVKKWRELNQRIMNDPQKLLEAVRSHCKLQGNVNLPLLNRCEGGLGGDSNQLNKQMRLTLGDFWPPVPDTVLVHFINADRQDGEQWTEEEKVDLLQSFAKTLSFMIGSGACCCHVFAHVKINDHDD